MVKLHIGCGQIDFGKEWIHVDPDDHEHVDYNEVTRLEFNNNSVDLIYCSGILGYLDRQEAASALEEYHRVLKSSGILRIAVPNFESITELYTVNPLSLYSKHQDKNYSLDDFLGLLYGKKPSTTTPTTSVYHKTIYDFDSLRSMLHNARFKNICLYDCNETEHANFDDHARYCIPTDKGKKILMSLNVECEK